MARLGDTDVEPRELRRARDCDRRLVSVEEVRRVFYQYCQLPVTKT